MEEENIVIKIHRPNAHELLFFFACGVVISVPFTLFIYQYTDLLLVGFDPFIIALFSAAFLAPFVEEFAKAFPLFYRHGETERSIFDLGLLVGFGFGIVEMLTYVFVLGSSIIYRLPGLFFHPASTAIIAYGIAKKRPLSFYIISVALHFANNFLAVTTADWAIGFAVSVATLTVLISWKLRVKTEEKIVI